MQRSLCGKKRDDEDAQIKEMRYQSEAGREPKTKPRNKTIIQDSNKPKKVKTKEKKLYESMRARRLTKYDSEGFISGSGQF